MQLTFTETSFWFFPNTLTNKSDLANRAKLFVEIRLNFDICRFQRFWLWINKKTPAPANTGSKVCRQVDLIRKQNYNELWNHQRGRRTRKVEHEWAVFHI